MTSSTRITLLLVVFGLAIFAVVAQFIQVDEQGIAQARYTTNAGELTRDVLFGQTFTSDESYLSGVSVMFATYSGRVQHPELHFHLRESTSATEDLRHVTVPQASLGDNQFYRFNFEPLADSQGKQYFFFVVSPSGETGASPTVDLDSRNPYHLGTAYIVRGKGSDVTNPEVLAASGKQTVDLAFTTYHRVPLSVAAVNRARESYHYTVATWDERQVLYLRYAKAALPALIFIAVLLGFRAAVEAEQGSKKFGWLLFAFFGLAIVWRVLYARELPVTTDEGNYLYDAAMLREGTLAGGDGYVKAPLVIAWAALWQIVAGNTILAGRMASVVIGALTLWPLYILGRELHNRVTGVAVAAVWAVFGAPVVFNIYVHTQPLAIFFAVAGIATLWLALRGKTPQLSFFANKKAPSSAGWFVLAGILMGLGVASRKSVLAVGLVPVLLIFLEGRSWSLRVRHLINVGMGFVLVLAVFLGGAYWVYGEPGVWEALGVNSAEDGISANEPSQLEQVRAYSLRGMTPFFRESLPLIIMAMLGWGFLLEIALRQVARHFVKRRPRASLLVLLDHVLPKLGWILPATLFWWAFSFFFEYEGEAFHIFGMPWLWYAMAIVLGVAIVWPRPEHEKFSFDDDDSVQASTQPGSSSLPPNVVGNLASQARLRVAQANINILYSISRALLLPAWLGGVAFFYTRWIKFHANYIAEFLPPLALLAGVGAFLLVQRLQNSTYFKSDHPFQTLGRRLILLAVLGVFSWAIFLSNHITFLYEHTGTFHQGAAKEAAAWAKEHIPADQTIFTGAALIPYLSGHHVALDIAHPRWYAYEFTRKDTQRLETFLPPIEDMLNAYRTATWFLHESQTGFSFMMEYSEIEAGLYKDFVPVKTIENGGNPLTFYQRVR